MRIHLEMDELSDILALMNEKIKEVEKQFPSQAPAVQALLLPVIERMKKTRDYLRKKYQDGDL